MRRNVRGTREGLTWTSEGHDDFIICHSASLLWLPSSWSFVCEPSQSTVRSGDCIESWNRLVCGMGSAIYPPHHSSFGNGPGKRSQGSYLASSRMTERPSFTHPSPGAWHLSAEAQEVSCDGSGAPRWVMCSVHTVTTIAVSHSGCARGAAHWFAPRKQVYWTTCRGKCQGTCGMGRIAPRRLRELEPANSAAHRLLHEVSLRSKLPMHSDPPVREG